MKGIRNRLLLTAAVSLAAGCGSSVSTPAVLTAPAVADRAPIALASSNTFFIPGETMRFELSLHGVVGGESVLAVGEPGTVAGQRVVIVRSRAQTAGVAAMVKKVEDEVESWVDVTTGKPVFLKADVTFGKREALIETRFNRGLPGSFSIDYQRKGKAKRRFRQRMPAGEAAFDAHSTLGALRAWQPSAGETSFFYVLAGRRLWRNDIVATKFERIRTELGRFDTLRIDGVARRVSSSLRPIRGKKTRSYTVWIGQDADRLPVLVMARTEYGDVKVELIEHHRPERPVTTARR